MKILCEVHVLNRNSQTKSTPRAVKSTLALGYKHSAMYSNDNTKKELEMMLFTPKIRNGQRYKLKDNIEEVHTRFVSDGKATICIKEPAENLLIKCDPIQLKGFLQTLKLGMEGKDAINLRLNIASATAISQKSQPHTKMIINRRSDYPIKGFPRSLQTLKINNSQLIKLSFEICSLRNLTHLDVGSNNLTKIPNELGRLRLTTLVLQRNNLGELNDWTWLKGSALRDSLCELDLSNNNLKYLPPSVVKCQNLVNLNLNENNLTHLPFAIRRLQKLRSLYVSGNKLESLPAAIDDLRIETLDIWGNSFAGVNATDLNRLNSKSGLKKNSLSSPQPLWLHAARCVTQYKLPIDSLPAILIQLIAEAPKCLCGNLCYVFDERNILRRVVQPKFINVRNLSYSRDHVIYADVIVCGHCKIGV